MPVRAVDRGAVVAAVSLSGPTARFDEQPHRHCLGDMLLADTSGLSVLLDNWVVARTRSREAQRAIHSDGTRMEGSA